MLPTTGRRDRHEIDFRERAAALRLPLIVRTAADVRVMRHNARAVRRLPPAGVRVAIEGLDPPMTKGLESGIRAYVRACGCAEGGAAGLGALLAVFAAIAQQMSARGPRWADLGVAGAGLMLAVLFGGIGKLLGITVARRRFERRCDDVIRTIEENELRRGSYAI